LKKKRKKTKRKKENETKERKEKKKKKNKNILNKTKTKQKQNTKTKTNKNKNKTQHEYIENYNMFNLHLLKEINPILKLVKIIFPKMKIYYSLIITIIIIMKHKKKLRTKIQVILTIQIIQFVQI